MKGKAFTVFYRACRIHDSALRSFHNGLLVCLALYTNFFVTRLFVEQRVTCAIYDPDPTSVSGTWPHAYDGWRMRDPTPCYFRQFY
jgi:hypothetical protein